MRWIWQLPHWPLFVYDSKKVAALESHFLQGAGGFFAVVKHLEEDAQKRLVIEVLSLEGTKSADIEGEVLKRESVQSSIKKHFGLTDTFPIERKEEGMGALMWQVYSTYDQTLTHEMLAGWNYLLMPELEKGYRTHDEPMQIVSGRLDRQIVYYEAPPSKEVLFEMERFVQWFNDSKKLPSLVRAALVHLYFECIHPFEDGNGRIGRVLVEKALSQSLGQATLISISSVIAKRKKGYYKALAACNRTLEIDSWIHFFAEVILEAQEESLKLVHFLIGKTNMLLRLEGKLNTRQEKVLLRLFAEGPKGFSGGLSAENYIAITKTSRATATRDLADLVEKKALYKTGTLRHTRYRLCLN